jgi:hypothetical protein
MAEYAMVTAAVALLAISLAGVVGTGPRQIPRSTAAALELVSSNARSNKVPVVGARAAFGKAPYRKAALKYVYAVGWITGTRDRETCFYTVSPSDAIHQASIELAHNAKVAAKLRRGGLTLRQAGTALVAGITAACND